MLFAESLNLISKVRFHCGIREQFATCPIALALTAVHEMPSRQILFHRQGARSRAADRSGRDALEADAVLRPVVEDEGNVPRSAALVDGVPGVLKVGVHGDRRSDPSLKPRHDGLVPGVA